MACELAPHCRQKLLMVIFAYDFYNALFAISSSSGFIFHLACVGARVYIKCSSWFSGFFFEIDWKVLNVNVTVCIGVANNDFTMIHHIHWTQSWCQNYMCLCGALKRESEKNEEWSACLSTDWKLFRTCVHKCHHKCNKAGNVQTESCQFMNT